MNAFYPPPRHDRLVWPVRMLAKANAPVDVQIRDMDRYTTLEVITTTTTYVAGRPGHAYSVVLQNQTASACCRIASWRERHQRADCRRFANRLVLAPYQRMEIRGCAQKHEDVAHSVHRSSRQLRSAYRSSENVGVIGCRGIRERRYEQYYEYEEDYGYGIATIVMHPSRGSSEAGAASDAAALRQ